MLAKILSASTHPALSCFRFLSRKRPDLFLRHYSRRARRQGFTTLRFILSFDCDTELDIEVVEGLHFRLKEIGISPVYAVPGQMLEKGAHVYRKVAEDGAEFINHGYYSHCHFDPIARSYVSNFFYDQLTKEAILNDISRGHQSVTEVLQRQPAGFRVPHFGSFQTGKDLRFLWATLRKMGYKYSTSTVPLFGFLNGPLKQIDEDFYEIPLSGCYDYPLRVLDSWGFRFDPTRDVTEGEYGRQFDRVTRFLMQDGNCGLLNIYADPSQVYDWELFFKCMVSVASVSVSSYQNLLKEMST